jgi:hypothetical protein
MEGLSDLLGALEDSALDEDVKRYLKDVVVAHVDEKGAAAMEAILDQHTKGSSS